MSSLDIISTEENHNQLHVTMDHPFVPKLIYHVASLTPSSGIDSQSINGGQARTHRNPGLTMGWWYQQGFDAVEKGGGFLIHGIINSQYK